MNVLLSNKLVSRNNHYLGCLLQGGIEFHGHIMLLLWSLPGGHVLSTSTPSTRWYQTDPTGHVPSLQRNHHQLNISLCHCMGQCSQPLLTTKSTDNWRFCHKVEHRFITFKIIPTSLYGTHYLSSLFESVSDLKAPWTFFLQSYIVNIWILAASVLAG